MNDKKRKIAELETELNKAFKALAPQIKVAKPVHVRALKPKEAHGWSVDIGVSYDESIAPAPGNMPMPPPNEMMLPNALFHAFFQHGITTVTLPPGEHNGMHARLEDLHGSVIGDNRTFREQLRRHYTQLLEGFRSP